MSEIHGYTLAQVRQFAAAIDRARRRRRLASLDDQRAAAAVSKDFQKYRKSISE